MIDTTAPIVSDQEFIYRATYSDGHVYETQPRRYTYGQPRFVGLAQSIARKRDPGVTVVRLVRVVGGEWSEA
jgi:hypothetical protein